VRLSPVTLVILAALAALIAIGVTDQILPATDPHTMEVRPWVAARALGITAYLLLALEVGLGLILSHPRNTAEARKTKQVFPWHEMVTVFTGAFLVLHITLLVIDPFAGVGVAGALVPGFSTFRPIAVGLGTVALYALIFTAATAKWTRLLPAGWWLKAHRFAAVTFLLVWTHAVLAGTDSGALTPVYLATGLPIIAGITHRWWTARSNRPHRALADAGDPAASFRRPRPAPIIVKES
jgi:predicted ferric reductase